MEKEGMPVIAVFPWAIDRPPGAYPLSLKEKGLTPIASHTHRKSYT
jgi:hypothetical protein